MRTIFENSEPRFQNRTEYCKENVLHHSEANTGPIKLKTVPNES